MNDVTTRRPLRVRDCGTAGSYVIVPIQQLKEICALLDAHGVAYSVDEFDISTNGGPPTTFINFNEEISPVAVQRILDEVQ